MDKKCALCETPLKLGGPLWLGPLHDDQFLAQVHEEVSQNLNLVNPTRVHATVQTLIDELKDVAFVYDIEVISSVLRINTVKLSTVYSALRNKNKRVSLCLAQPSGIKTEVDYATFVVIFM